jgi:hypothetical protein
MKIYLLGEGGTQPNNPTQTDRASAMTHSHKFGMGMCWRGHRPLVAHSHSAPKLLPSLRYNPIATSSLPTLPLAISCVICFGQCSSKDSPAINVLARLRHLDMSSPSSIASATPKTSDVQDMFRHFQDMSRTSSRSEYLANFHLHVSPRRSQPDAPNAVARTP